MKELFTKDAKIYILSVVLVLGYGFGCVVPPVISKIAESQKQISEVSTQIIELEKKKAAVIVPQNLQAAKPDIPITIFKSPYAGTDLESAGMELVYQLLKIIGATGNKITEISMTPGAQTAAAAPQSQASPTNILNSIKNKSMQQSAPSGPSGTMNISMSLDCSYISLQNLLQKVSTWNYLAEIKNVSIEPASPGNSSDLISKLSIDLYISQ